MEDVLVTNVVARSHCVPFKLGTASHGVVRNVRFVDCRVEAPRRDYSSDRDPLAYRPHCWRPWCEKDFPASRREEPAGISGIALECVDGGLVEDIVCRDIVIDGGCYVPIFVRAGWRQNRSTGAPRGRHNVMRRILFENVSGHSLSSVPSSVTGIPGFRVQDVTFRNVRLTGRGGGDNAAERTRHVPELEGNTPGAGMFRQALPAYGLWARHVDGLKLEGVEFSLEPGTTDRREMLVLDDVRGK